MTHRLLVDGQLVLFGTVGMAPFFQGDDGFTADEVVRALAEVDGDLTVRINSGGGIAFDGVSIMNALKMHEGEIAVVVEGIAASAASIIAMAGDHVAMGEGAMLMIHGASGITMGTSEDHEKMAGVLGKLDGQMAKIYAKASGRPVAEMAARMAAETWMTAEEAVEMGFASVALGEDAAPEPAAFDYRVYAHAPPRLVAMADVWAQAGRIRRTIHPAAPAAPIPRLEFKEISDMTDNTAFLKALTIDGLTAARPDLIAAMRADMAAAGADEIKAARTDAAKAERDRILGIEAQMLPGHSKLIADMKADGVTTIAEAAVKVLAAERAKGPTRLRAIMDDEKELAELGPEPVTVTAPAPAADDVSDAALEARWAKDAALRAEFAKKEWFFSEARAEAKKKARNAA